MDISPFFYWISCYYQGAGIGENDYLVELVCLLMVKEMQLTYPAISAITKHRNMLKALGVKLEFNFQYAIFALLA
jgi:hypothetical protein